MKGQGHQIFVDELARFAAEHADARVTAIAERAAAPLRVAVRGRRGVGRSTVARALDRAGSASEITVSSPGCAGDRSPDSDVDVIVYVTAEVIKPIWPARYRAESATGPSRPRGLAARIYPRSPAYRSNR
jgi:hypothetical protein